MPKKIKYTKKELEIVKYIEKHPKSVPHLAKEISKYGEIFKENVAKRKPINLRILESDLVKIKARALHEGIPYQSLIGSVLHKYVNGDLIVRA